jgi:cell fate (sporulation/competence/biofilm development) regulator YlbF (YheA/YmcA/DUF963 family)
MLIINDELLVIDELIDRLVDELMDLPEVRRYQILKRDFETDESLQKKLQILADNQEYIAFRTDLRELQKEIMLDKKVYELKIAENDLQALLSNLTKSIVKPISESIFIDENLPLKGGSRHARHHGHG